MHPADIEGSLEIGRSDLNGYGDGMQVMPRTPPSTLPTSAQTGRQLDSAMPAGTGSLSDQ